jgi:two-component system chemotaxis sensor kinase CheA
MGLAQRAGVVTEHHDRAISGDSDQESAGHDERESLLLVGVGERGRLAIPLSSIARLEEIPHDTIEYAAEQEVVQYRGDILPLLRISKLLSIRGAGQGEEDGPMQVVVYSRDGKSAGLVVDRIIDVVEEAYTLQRRGARRGFIGSAVIGEKVTDLLDLEGLIKQHDPSFFETPAPLAGVGV